MALELLIAKQQGTQSNWTNTIPADLSSDTSVEISYLISDIKDISDTTGSYTKTIDLPDTPTNRYIFGYITSLSSDTISNVNLNIGNPYNPNMKLKCFVLEDTIVVFEGYIQLTKYIINNTDQNKMISATIYADNAAFFIHMGDSLITDIDFSEYDFVWDEITIQNTWNNDTDWYVNGIYFPLIDYGHGWTLDDLNNPSVYNLGVKDFLPAISIKIIWDKIFQYNNFSYISKFCGGINNNGTLADPRFGNLILPFYKQSFQNDSLFNQDKIWHVGLSQSTIAQNSTYSIGQYSGKNSTVDPGDRVIVNANSGVGGIVSGSQRNLWYDGYMISPTLADPNRNNLYPTGGSIGYTFSRFETSLIIPFTLTASPMFDVNISGTPLYDTTDYTYTNLTATSSKIFKQRFVLETDLVMNYSNDFNIAHGWLYFNYSCRVDFYRSIDPTTGVTATNWSTGQGYRIPADLGVIGSTLSGNYQRCHDRTGATISWGHIIADDTPDSISNCFDKYGTAIVPAGTDRYLGKYCTSRDGTNLLQPGSSFQSIDDYDNRSGDCVSFYYNDGYTQSTTALKGLWVSGVDPSIIYTSGDESPYQPRKSDWYNGLLLQTIYLDGDNTNPWYGVDGTIIPLGNTPIQYGEQVRCVITFGHNYGGSFITSPATVYQPPGVCYLLTQTYFGWTDGYLTTNPNGIYNTTASNPLTQFYNDVSLDYITGQTVKFNDLLPTNTKQKDFVQSIIRMHNLYLEPAKNSTEFPNTLISEPRDLYYGLATDYLDWRNKLDISQPINIQVLAETQNKRTLFNYQTDSDWYNKLYTQNTRENYGQFIFSLNNEFLISTLTIDCIFSPTPMTTLFSFNDVLAGDITLNVGGFVLPVLISGAAQTPNSNSGPNGMIQTNMRILLKNYITTTNGDELYMFNVGTSSYTVAPTTFYPYAGPYDDPYNPSYTLNWGQTRGEFFNTATDQFFNNLVNTYWASLLTEMGDIDSRLITCNMFLTPNDINNFQFYKQVLVNIDGVDGYYKVNAINSYIPGTNMTCEVVLLKSNSQLNIPTYNGSTNLGARFIGVIVPGGGGGPVDTGGTTG